MLLQSSVHAALIESNVMTRNEILIPFNIDSISQTGEEIINISHLGNVEIKEINIDNGKGSATVEDGILKLKYSDGEKSSKETGRKVEILEIEKAEYDEEFGGVIITPKDMVTAIKDVYGAFETATILENGDILLKVKSDAVFEEGFSEEKTAFSEIEIQAEPENRERNFKSEWVELPYPLVNNKVSVIEDTSGVQKIDVKNNAVRVCFSEGIPVRNTIYENGGHTYFWIDRFQDGSFRAYNPNSIYTTDRNIIDGEGSYIGKKDRDEVGMTLTNENWIDFCGVEIDGKKYTRLFDKKKGIPELSYNESLVGKEFTIEGGDWNTERYVINLSKAGVSYFPEGKLFSMGSLVPDTVDWGEEMKNHPWESKETFFNSITGDFETYVKHYKFFYGPKTKCAFGGYYTYPYRCKVQYKHYQPVKLYSGGICYEYVGSAGELDYQYSGYVRVEFDAVTTNNAPTAPYHIIFHKGSKLLSWVGGTDDFTPPEDLRYEIELKQEGEWKRKAVSLPGETSLNLEDFFEDIRIRTLDEADLASVWGKLEESMITLTGSVEPYVILQGEKIDLLAETKSFYDITSVRAVNKALNLDVSLLSETKEIPDFYEISFEVEEKNPKKQSEINLNNAFIATNESGKVQIQEFIADYQEKEDDFVLFLPYQKPFEESGSVVITVGKDNITSLSFQNAIFGVNESFIEVICERDDTGKIIVPQLKVNCFRYDEKGEANYYVVDLENELPLKPITITWNTDVYGMTEFHIFCGEREVFIFRRSWTDINDVFHSFKTYKSSGEKVYRLLFLNQAMSKEALKRHQTLLGSEKIGIQKDVVESVYGNQVAERVERFVGKNLSTSKSSTPGLYSILVTAEDRMGNQQTAEVILQVEQLEEVLKEENKDDEKQDTSGVRGKSFVLGRLFYEKNRAYMEELKKPKKINNSEGFLCAGETLVLRIELKNTDTLLVDLKGDKSIKTLDSLTERFLCDDGEMSAEELKYSYQFPKLLYPIFKDAEKGTSTFQLKYVVPYRTKQTLHSWITLKNSALEEIDTNRLFDRMQTPYQLLLYPDGLPESEIKIKFDVFERWDTVLNRDVSRYLKNAGDRKKVSLGSR